MRFSILVPCYNLAPWLRDCLDSVRAQKCEDWECVIVDDGSTDESSAILADAALSDCRFRIVRQTNAGVGAARNTALAAARGEWVVFLDGDDVLAPDALVRIAVAAKTRPEASAVRFGYVRFQDEDSHPDFGLPGGAAVVFRDCRRSVPMTVLRSYLWQVAFRRTVVAGMRFAHYCRGEDGLFLVEAFLRRVDSYIELFEALYGYRRRRGSAMQSQMGRRILLDELDHRLDIARLTVGAEKTIDYSDPLWLEWIEDYYLNHWRLLKPVRGEWLARLRQLQRLPVFSRWGSIRVLLAVRFPWALRLVSIFGRRR